CGFRIAASWQRDVSGGHCSETSGWSTSSAARILRGPDRSVNGSKVGSTWSGPWGLSVRPRWIRRAPGCGLTKPQPSCRREGNDAHVRAPHWALAAVLGGDTSTELDSGDCHWSRSKPQSLIILEMDGSLGIRPPLV